MEGRGGGEAQGVADPPPKKKINEIQNATAYRLQTTKTVTQTARKTIATLASVTSSR
jgi:hypothetical protein